MPRAEYECPHCYRMHRTWDYAFNCCEKTIDLYWRCDRCRYLHYTEEEAALCCEGRRDGTEAKGSTKSR